MEASAIASLVVSILILTGVVVAIRWSARKSRDIADYYDDFEDPTAKALDRANEMRAGRM